MSFSNTLAAAYFLLLVFFIGILLLVYCCIHSVKTEINLRFCTSKCSEHLKDLGNGQVRRKCITGF